MIPKVCVSRTMGKDKSNIYWFEKGRKILIT